MIGNTDINRSEGQGGLREQLSTKEVWSKGATIGTRTGREAGCGAISVLGNAKSNSQRKTHQVEPDGPSRKLIYLTRGDLRGASQAEVSRSHSSEDIPGNGKRAKGGRTTKERSSQALATKSVRQAETELMPPERRPLTKANRKELGGFLGEEGSGTACDGSSETGSKKMLNEVQREAISLEKILSKENLRKAYQAVKSNGGGSGVDGKDMQESRLHLKENWVEIEKQLRRGKYEPGAVKAVEIPKSNGATRRLGIPNIQDRIIQQAIHQELSRMWEGYFSEASYGFREGRSAHDALRAAQNYIKEGKRWVVDIDLQDFFDEVNHDRLMRLLAEKIRDKELLRLIGRYLRSPMQYADASKQKRRKGTPQGGPLSPLLANIYLDALDKELHKRGLCFVRYADDIAIYVSSQRAAERVLESVTKWITKHLKVRVNQEKSKSGPTQESSLLGFRLQADAKLELSERSVKRYKKRVKELWEARQNRSSTQLRNQWRRYIHGWWEYFKVVESKRKLQELKGWTRRHMRKCFWQRWKTAKARLRQLKKLGVKGPALGNAYSSRGAWAMSKHYVMHKALNNQTLQHYGFDIPWDFA